MLIPFYSYLNIKLFKEMKIYSIVIKSALQHFPFILLSIMTIYLFHSTKLLEIYVSQVKLAMQYCLLFNFLAAAMALFFSPFINDTQSYLIGFLKNLSVILSFSSIIIWLIIFQLKCRIYNVIDQIASSYKRKLCGVLALMLVFIICPAIIYTHSLYYLIISATIISFFFLIHSYGANNYFLTEIIYGLYIAFCSYSIYFSFIEEDDFTISKIISKGIINNGHIVEIFIKLIYLIVTLTLGWHLGIINSSQYSNEDSLSEQNEKESIIKRVGSSGYGIQIGISIWILILMIFVAQGSDVEKMMLICFSMLIGIKLANTIVNMLISAIY